MQVAVVCLEQSHDTFLFTAYENTVTGGCSSLLRTLTTTENARDVFSNSGGKPRAFLPPLDEKRRTRGCWKISLAALN